MAFVDFYHQSSLFNRPRDLNLPSNSPTGSTARLVYNGDPADDLEDHGVFVDIEDFMGSVLHIPADWRARWGPVIHAVKRNPDFMKHYLKHRSRHENEYAKPEESHYESLLLMNDIIVRAAFPTVPSQGATPTPLLLRQFVHIVDDGSSDCILDDGSFIPRLVAKGKVTRTLHVYPPLTGNRRTPILKLCPPSWRSYVQFCARKLPEAETRLGIHRGAEEIKTRCYVGPREGGSRDRYRSVLRDTTAPTEATEGGWQTFNGTPLPPPTCDCLPRRLQPYPVLSCQPHRRPRVFRNRPTIDHAEVVPPQKARSWRNCRDPYPSFHPPELCRDRVNTLNYLR